MGKINNEEIKKLDKYFRCTNYLSVGQLYLLDNPLLKRPLSLKDIKPNVVGHWGTAPGQNFVYTHLNRVIKKYDLNMIYISGPGHGGEAMIANSYIDGSYTSVYPNITEDENGLKKLFKQFSFPGGVSSHVSPETPGSINEGGELGYSLAHAYGAVLDNPNLIAACVIGDGEAETGPLAASWQINKIINPKEDGTVLPILHLNGYKIANPTVLSRIPTDELVCYFRGLGYKPYIVKGNDVMKMHKLMAKTMDEVIEYIKKIKEESNKYTFRPFYPMIILITPKGWTGPKECEGSFKAHQIPLIVNKDNKDNVYLLEKWLKSYKPNELFNEDGSIKKSIKDMTPALDKTMSLNKNANGGLLLKNLITPDIHEYEFKIKEKGTTYAEDMRELGKYIRDLVSLNKDNYRIFGPDEALSNRLNYVFDVTSKKWGTKIIRQDELLKRDGRVIDGILSEHVCEGMLEGYLLSGRHGFIHSYEAFARIIDSMVSQHAKWIKVTKELPFREEISSLNILLTSHCWQQDHNGFTHQDPGFINHLLPKKSDTVRIYLPFDTNTLISTFDHITKTKNYINLVIASKHPRLQYLTMDEAIEHCKKGVDIFEWASNTFGKKPDVVLACAGDTPTLEVLAASSILRKEAPSLKVRVVNVVDLMKLEQKEKHPHGLTDKEYDSIFTKDKPILFVFHGYPNVIHELTYNRTNKEMHVRGYNEEGTITTPFDMRVQNKIDRYHIILDVLKYTNKTKKHESLKKYCEKMLEYHHDYIRENGKDIKEVLEWKWNN